MAAAATSPRGLRPMVHKTKSHNDIASPSPPTVSDTIKDPGDGKVNIKSIKIVRSNSTGSEAITRQRDANFAQHGNTDIETTLLRELYAIRTLMANVVEVSPRGTQFERLLSRADAQVGNASAAISRIVLLDKNMQDTLKKMNDTLAAVLRVQNENQVLIHTCVNRIDFMEGIVLATAANVKQDTKMLESVFEMLAEWEMQTKNRESDARIANIEAMMLALGNASDHEE